MPHANHPSADPLGKRLQASLPCARADRLAPTAQLPLAGRLALATRLAGAAALTAVALAGTCLFAGPAHAAPPADAASLAQAPGYYRQVIGSLRVTALFDGVVPLGRNLIVGMTPKQIDAQLFQRYVPETPAGMQTAVNAYLVEHDGRLTLVDAGTAKCFGDALGHVVENLRLAGFKPEQVDDILVTHAHPDHLCGVLDDKGAIAFPNATLWLPRADDAFVRDPEAEKHAPEAFKGIFGLARKVIEPWQTAGKLKLFGAGDALPAGVSLVASPGHTPGHSSYLFDGGKDAKLLVWGDVVHYHAVQFATPEASFEVDADRARAIDSRRKLMATATREGWWVAGAHLPFPGLGHVRGENKNYAWVPAEYSPLPAGK
ncbi:MBL fold metallo-hydrolase [Derxia gummosa]|uniref:MBL fold metallo-hydrolase n=1 Tax=Derxia gummosa DSM 723 TaxID=1121388 RepID=A0A8B6X9Y4_9BURK|nr:MBL fold metallo-hydrolase [Derxia gummosa]